MSTDPTEQAIDTTFMPPPGSPMGGMEAQADFVGEGLTDALYGKTVEYRYTRGNHYRLAFDHGGRVTFDLLSHEGGPPPPLLPYRARRLRDDQYLVHWLVKPGAIHVSLVIDLGAGTVTVGAMMPPNRWEFFDVAQILSVQG